MAPEFDVAFNDFNEMFLLRLESFKTSFSPRSDTHSQTSNFPRPKICWKYSPDTENQIRQGTK